MTRYSNDAASCSSNKEAISLKKKTDTRILDNNFALILAGHTYLLQEIRLLDGFQHVLLGGLLRLAAQQELIQDKISLLKIKDDIQLTHLRWRTTFSVFVTPVYGVQK